MNTQLIQLRFSHKRGLAIDERYHAENMTLTRRDGSVHSFTKEADEFVSILRQEFLTAFGKSLSSNIGELEPVFLEFNGNDDLREKFRAEANSALVEQWCVQNQELLQELLVRAGLHHYKICCPHNKPWGQWLVKGVNKFVRDAAEELREELEDDG
mgnify:CR=1 FL=1